MMNLIQDGRRTLLKSAGVTLALPMLPSLASEVGSPAMAKPDATAKPDAKAKRLVCIGSNLGLYRKALYPTQTGRDYELTPLMQPLAEHRDQLTLLSGFDHRAGNGHGNWDNFLCGKRVGSVTLDQMVAEQVGRTTRLESMQLCAGDIPRQRMVFSREGVPLPMINRPSVVYGKLFASADDRARQDYLLRSGQSALDVVQEDAQALKRRLGSDDQRKLQEYFSSLRELESRMSRQLAHLSDSVEEVDYELPAYDPMAPTLMLECEQIMFDMMALALQTDSTRVATLFIAGLGQVFTLDGETMRAGYHALSHHGNDPDLIRDLIRVETEHMRCLARFLGQLKDRTDETGQPLLDSTVVMFGTGMGDASRHSNRDLPTLIAGGGLSHGQHVAADPTDDRGPQLGNVFVSLLQHFGVETDAFSDVAGRVDHWT